MLKKVVFRLFQELILILMILPLMLDLPTKSRTLCGSKLLKDKTYIS